MYTVSVYCEWMGHKNAPNVVSTDSCTARLCVRELGAKTQNMEEV